MKIILFWILLTIHLSALTLTPLSEEKVMGMDVKFYKLPSENYLFERFSSDTGHEVIESSDEMVMTHREDRYYYVGEFLKKDRQTGFVVSGKNKFLVLGIGRMVNNKMAIED